MDASKRRSPADELRFGESALELVCGLSQRFVDDLHVIYHGHEVRVAVPSRNDVKVHVVGNPGSGGAADVGADVEAIGLERCTKNLERSFLPAHQVKRLGVVEFF